MTGKKCEDKMATILSCCSSFAVVETGETIFGRERLGSFQNGSTIGMNKLDDNFWPSETWVNAELRYNCRGNA